jgi:hypothetical protein
VLQATAQALGVFDDAGQPFVKPVSLVSLFRPVLPDASSAIVDFPIVLFDPVARRWLVAAAYSDKASNPARPGVPLLAASLTDDPTGEWKVYALPAPHGVPGIDACAAGTHYPVVYNTQATLDANGVYVTGEALCAAVSPGAAQDIFAGAFVLAVPKSSVFSATSLKGVNVAIYTDLQVKASADSRPGGGAGATQWVQLQPARPQTAADAGSDFVMFAAQVGLALLGWESLGLADGACWSPESKLVEREGLRPPSGPCNGSAGRLAQHSTELSAHPSCRRFLRMPTRRVTTTPWRS